MGVFTDTENTVFHWEAGAPTEPSVGDPSGIVAWTMSGTTEVAGVFNAVARRFNGTSDYIKFYDARTDDAGVPIPPYEGAIPALRAALQSEFTGFFIFTLSATPGTGGRLLYHGSISNLQSEVLVQYASSVGEFWEGHHRNASGTSQLVQSGLDAILAGRSYVMTLTMDSGVYKYFLNGACIWESGTLFAAAEEGDDENTRWATNIGVNGVATNGTGYFAGDIEEIFYENRCWTEEEIREEVLRIFTLAAPDYDGTAPTITNVSPAGGSSIGRNDAWSGRVSEGTALRRVMLWVKLTDSAGVERGREVIWDGTEFAALYRSLSARTEVTPGLVYDFSVKRSGGWPFNPEVFASAIDTSGNEAS